MLDEGKVTFTEAIIDSDAMRAHIADTQARKSKIEAWITPQKPQSVELEVVRIRELLERILHHMLSRDF